MRFFHAAAFAVALTLTSIPVIAAQEPDQNKEKPKPQDEEKKKKEPSAKEKEKPQPKADERPQNEPATDKDKPKSDTDKRSQPPKQDERANRQEKQRQAPESNRNQSAQRGTRTNARRIPPEKFHASFGREHHFRVERHGDRQFQYGGYAFEFVEVLPAGWSYDDECFIEEDGDDYYLVDVVHPEIRVLVVIVG